MIPAPDDGDSRLNVWTRSTGIPVIIGRQLGRRPILAGVFEDEVSEDFHHGRVVFWRTQRHPFQGVDTTDPRSESPGPKLSDRLGVPVGHPAWLEYLKTLPYPPVAPGREDERSSSEQARAARTPA